MDPESLSGDGVKSVDNFLYQHFYRGEMGSVPMSPCKQNVMEMAFQWRANDGVSFQGGWGLYPLLISAQSVSLKDL